MNLESTRQGDEDLENEEGQEAGTLDKKSDTGKDTRVDARMAVMEAAAEAADRDRTIRAGTRQEDMPAGEPVPEQGLQYQQEMHPENQGSSTPEGYEDDPLAEFIELDANGQPMFRMVVDGQTRLMPLEKARAALQKNEAADKRLKSAAEKEKEAQRRLEEAMLLQSKYEEILSQQQNRPPEPDADIDEAALIAQAEQVVSDLFHGSEKDAAAKLASLLVKSKGASKATQVNIEEIVKRAEQAAERRVEAREYEKDIRAGLATLRKDYPEIFEDEKLFAAADSMATTIAEEHPDWSPSQVMLEAGAQVREWMNRLKGESISEQNEGAQNDRQERKRQLRPLPRSRQGTQEREPEEQPESPADVLAAIREARGQAV
jgi:hypothetical protein